MLTNWRFFRRNKLSRIRNDEMREFMKQVVDRLYTVLLRLDDPGVLERLDQYARSATRAWDAPKNLTDWLNDWLGEVRH